MLVKLSPGRKTKKKTDVRYSAVKVDEKEKLSFFLRTKKVERRDEDPTTLKAVTIREIRKSNLCKAKELPKAEPFYKQTLNLLLLLNCLSFHM
jgi:hypothetical protein